MSWLDHLEGKELAATWHHPFQRRITDTPQFIANWLTNKSPIGP